MGRYRAVLLDWRGVVALDPEPSWWVRRALASLGRRIDPEVVDAAVAGITAAGSLPEILEAERHEDCSADLNRSISWTFSPKVIPCIQTFRTCSPPSERWE